MEHTKDSVGIRVLGDLNQVLPSLHEQWELPSNLTRTLDSEPRTATWRDMEILENLENFLKSKITQTEEEINLINSKIEKIDNESLQQLQTGDLENLPFTHITVEP